jgi:hypothetical protein
MAATNLPLISPTLTIRLTAAERRRLEAAARCCDVTAEKFTRNLLLAAVRSIEGERRP